jgi:hypothetical protein
LSEQEEVEAFDFLKGEVFKKHLKDLRDGVSLSAGTNSSDSSASASAAPLMPSALSGGTSTLAAGAAVMASASLSRTSAPAAAVAAMPSASPGSSTGKASPRSSTDLEQGAGPSLPKRLQLISYFKIPEKPSGPAEQNSFDDMFCNDIEKVCTLYEPLRYRCTTFEVLRPVLNFFYLLLLISQDLDP